MKRLSWVVLPLVVAALGALVGCGDDDNGDGPGPLATETWQSTASGARGSGSGTWTLEEHSNGSTTVEGQWLWNDTPLGVEVTCPFTTGLVMIAQDTLMFTASGAATATGVPNSPFTLNVIGITSNGSVNNGGFIITFSGVGWPDTVLGSWTGTRTGGSGITQ
jgi:hypothetical protein